LEAEVEQPLAFYRGNGETNSSLAMMTSIRGCTPQRADAKGYKSRTAGAGGTHPAELSVLSRQCLDRRIPNKQVLIEEVAAWEEDRNKNHTKADWQFTTADARIKLKRLYPAL
jgi:hypothetical protein